MKAWDDLVSTALLGTSRRAVPEAVTVASTAVTDAGLAHPDAAGRLLDHAAVLAMYRRAGVRPRTGVSTGEPAPTETLARVSDAAAGRLEHLLADRVGMLPEWLTLCARARARVPEEVLPALFERARGNWAVAALLGPVMGERGRWLAAQNPDWQRVLDRARAPAAESLDAEVWETGGRADRVGYLAGLRRAEPDAARELLATGWDSEDAQDRAEFLAVLTVGLSAADEEFLERALDDRRKEVRATAELLIGRLAGSAYAARMRERLLPLIQVLPGGLRRKPHLEVSAPPALDAAAQRDGIPAGSRAQSAEEARRLWLRRLIACCPLAAWSEATGLSPGQVVELPVEPYDETVRAGWWDAAVRQQNASWAEALLATWRPDKPGMPGELLELLEPQQQREITARMLDKYPAEEAAVTWIAECPGPWDVRLGRAVLSAIGQLRRHRPFALHGLRGVLADRLPIQLVDELQTLADQREDPITATLNKVAEDIRFRDEMAQELSKYD